MDTTIKIDSVARDRLAALAQARGMSMRALIEEFAAASLTPRQLQERAERTRAFLDAEFGHRLTDEDTSTLRARMREAQAAHRQRLGKTGAGTGAAA
ncbi:hypothetical protein ACIQ9Q_39860 [Streptomyces sp. NPDC094438]|uniref:hypothetical protein n=1 Tax=Streptomyces sp. NPDC094438 TaxID=3366061 RepID=UPI003808FBED